MDIEVKMSSFIAQFGVETLKLGVCYTDHFLSFFFKYISPIIHLVHYYVNKNNQKNFFEKIENSWGRGRFSDEKLKKALFPKK